MKKLYAFLLIIIGGSSSINAQCDHTLTLTDSWGDGWNGATADLIVDGITVISAAEPLNTPGGGAATSENFPFSASSFDVIEITNWVSGAYDTEIGWSIADGDGFVIANGVYGDIAGGSGYCPAVAATCTDGIQNGDETGVDCGGATCPPCAPVLGDCFSSGLYDYIDNEDVGDAVGFVANTPGDYITLTFSAGETETGYDYWFVNDAADGSGTTIATGDGSIIGAYESITGEISFYVESDGSVQGSTFDYALSCNGPNSANCTDGIQNGDETGIDCGGATCPPCSFTGLNEISVESLNVYPNPASNEITVSINENMIDNQIVILDQVGKVVLKVVVLNLNTTINVSSLSKGLYYVKVGENTFSKFIKN